MCEMKKRLHLQADYENKFLSWSLNLKVFSEINTATSGLSVISTTQKVPSEQKTFPPVQTKHFRKKATNHLVGGGRVRISTNLCHEATN